MPKHECFGYAFKCMYLIVADWCTFFLELLLFWCMCISFHREQYSCLSKYNFFLYFKALPSSSCQFKCHIFNVTANGHCSIHKCMLQEGRGSCICITLTRGYMCFLPHFTERIYVHSTAEPLKMTEDYRMNSTQVHIYITAKCVCFSAIS